VRLDRLTLELGTRHSPGLTSLDLAGDLVAHMTGYECTVSSALAESFRRNDVRVPA
jgi:hypothetical protein